MSKIIIANKQDKCGMYSKAGITTTEMFCHLLGLQKRDSNTSSGTNNTHSPTKFRSKPKQPFAKCLSREQFYRGRSSSDHSTFKAQYNPKYNLVHRYTYILMRKITINIPFGEPKTSVRKVEEHNEAVYDTHSIDKVKGFVQLSKQLSREQSRMISPQVNEKRFESVNSTAIYARPRSATFKGIGHSSNENSFYCRNFVYEVNLDAVRRKSSIVGPSFKNVLGRRSVVQKQICLQEQSLVNYDELKDKIYPNSKRTMIDFNKMISRDITPVQRKISFTRSTIQPYITMDGQ